jgi:trimeric autotransporter adhesin
MFNQFGNKQSSFGKNSGSFGKKLLLAYLAALTAARGATPSLVAAPNAQSFGQRAVNSATAATQTLAFTFSGAAAPAFSLAYGSEFAISSPNCSGSGTISCTILVGFQPRWPGLRQDALFAKDSSGNVIATVLLYGTGLGPELALYPGIISTVAGTGTWSYSGDGGPALSATLTNPQGVAIDNAGNLYVADSISQVVRKVNAATGVISTVAGNGLVGYSGDGGLAVKATLNNPLAVALDGAGNLYIADQGNNAIRKVNAVTRQITTVAGGATSGSGVDGIGDGGPATSALLNGPNDIALDGLGNLYIADSFNGLIRRVDAVSGQITVAVGSGLNNPMGIALDAAGNLYIADTSNNVIRRVDAVSGKVTIVAGTGVSGFGGDSGAATNAKLATPVGVRLDAAGNLYIADQANNRIRQVNAQSGIITTIAGTGAAKYLGDGGVPTAAALNAPTGVAVDAAGNVFIADYANNVIRKIVPMVTKLAFPSTLVGEASAPQTLTALNIGNQNLTFSGVTTSANFSLATGCSSSTVLPASGSCMIIAAFDPTTTGNLSGSLSIIDNSLNVNGATQSVSLTGTATTGAVPQLSFSPASLTFAAQGIGTSSSAQTITVSNTGTADLNLSGIQLAGANVADFSITTACQSVIAAKASCSVSMIFSPQANGLRTASVLFYDVLANSPQSVSVTGIGGAPQVAFSPNALTFSNQPVGSASSASTITISNTGSATLNLAALAVTGANATDFSMTSNCGNTVAAGASCSASISFSPHGFGLRTANFTIVDNAAGSTQSVGLSGKGSMWATPTVWRPSNGTWYVSQTSGGTSAARQWGQVGDIPVPGDYDGDGKTDIAVYRPSSGTWWIVSSQTGAGSVQTWGMPGDQPVPGDYDGDGKTDLAVYRPSDGSWYIVSSRTGAGSVQAWGMLGDQPIPSDYDGDGRTDIAVFRPSNGTWYIILSRTWSGYSFSWGGLGDIPMPADYDGDGKTDIVVYRPSNGTWYIVLSRTWSAYSFAWGGLGDIPMPADYDGDGKADIAAYRPSNGTWYIVPSKTGYAFSLQLGLSNDTPLASVSK